MVVAAVVVVTVADTDATKSFKRSNSKRPVNLSTGLYYLVWLLFSLTLCLYGFLINLLSSMSLVTLE